MINSHRFDSSAEAYNACQCDDRLVNGDTLICGDGVVGVVGTWPIAVTLDHGELHSFIDVADGANDLGVAEAKKWAVNLGLALQD